MADRENQDKASLNSNDPLLDDARTPSSASRKPQQQSPLQPNIREPLLRQGQPRRQYTQEEREAIQRRREEAMRQAQEREQEMELKYGAESVLALIKPVSACMIVVIATIRSVTYFSQNDTSFAYTPFEADDTESDSQRFGGALLNALIIIAIVVAMTFFLLLLYKYECYKFIHGWLLMSSLLLLFFFSYQYVEQVLIAQNASIDWITMAVSIWNFGTVGLICIHWRGPLLLQQFYLVAVSALMALVLIKNLPDWTTWVVLAAIAIYDLFAVLSPCGPLKALVETAQERDEPLFPALIYSSTMAWIVTMADKDDDTTATSSTAAPADQDGARDVISFTPTATGSVNAERRPANQAAVEQRQRQQQQRPEPEEEEESSGVKLGLGDFIFYSVLVGKAATANEWTTITACYIAILVGLACTLLLLSIYQKALPALPISIFFGLVFFFVTSELLDPLINRLNQRQLFL